jgi:hypothetical protein
MSCKEWKKLHKKTFCAAQEVNATEKMRGQESREEERLGEEYSWNDGSCIFMTVVCKDIVSSPFIVIRD